MDYSMANKKYKKYKHLLEKDGNNILYKHKLQKYKLLVLSYQKGGNFEEIEKTLRQEIEIASNEKKGLEIKNQEQDEINEKIINIIKQFIVIREKNTNNVNEINNLKKELESVQMKVVELEKAKNEQEIALKTKTEEGHIITTDLANLTEAKVALDAAQKDLGQSHNETEQKEQKEQNEQKQLTIQATELNETANKELERLKTNLSKITEEKEELINKLKENEIKLTESREKIEQKQNKIETFEKTIKELVEQKKGIDNEIRELMTDNYNNNNTLYVKLMELLKSDLKTE